MSNIIYKLVGQKVTAIGPTGAQIKHGFLTCVNAEKDEYRIAAKEDRGMEGLYFSGFDVDRVSDDTLHFKPFV